MYTNLKQTGFYLFCRFQRECSQDDDEHMLEKKRLKRKADEQAAKLQPKGLEVNRRVITDAVIECHLNRENFSLTSLDLSFTRAGDKSLMTIAQYCAEQLRYLEVSNCAEVTPDGLVWVAMRCR